MHAYRRRAAAEPGAILLEASAPASGLAAGIRERSLLFTQPVEWLEVHQLDELPGLFAKLARAREAGLWAAGYLNYECGYHWEPTAVPGFQAQEGSLPLAAFGLYRAPVPCEPGQRGAASAANSTSRSAGCGLDTVSFSMDREVFAASIARIRRWIEAGDTYQVNLTGQVTGQMAVGSSNSAAIDPEQAAPVRFFADRAAELFTHMMERQPVPYGALLRIGRWCILSASPELFFAQRGRRITVRPMKGTAPRGDSPSDDAGLAEALAQDPKNRAENIMIVDLLRSDLGRIAMAGSVQVEKLFTVEQFPTLLQMSSEITATLRPEVTAYDLFASLFPSGSIVGAPKVRTMQILRELEQRERGVYTGAIGYFAPDGDAVFSVAIRTAVLEQQQLTMGVGAGITYDSDADAEYDECLLKASFLQEPAMRLIETMRVEAGSCALLARHLDRLGASAAHFGFLFERASTEAGIARQIARFANADTWRLRLTLAADGIVRFSPAEPVVPDCGPLAVMLWPEAVQTDDPLLQHKTTRRALYDKAVAAARQQGCVDALFVNERGELTEGAIHNVVVRHGDRWRTPPLEAGVLPGVYRAHLLATMPALKEEGILPAELATADALWLTNAVRGMRLVRLAPATRQSAHPVLSSEIGYVAESCAPVHTHA